MHTGSDYGDVHSEQREREGEDFGELSRVAPSGSANGGGDVSPYKRVL
jgi:hypothetical protein